MRIVFQVLSLIALIGTILPPIFFFRGSASLDAVKTMMTISTIAWFIVTPLWMGRTPNASSTS